MWCPEFDGLYEVCADTNMRSDGSIIGDRVGHSCDKYTHNPSFCGNFDTAEFIAEELCCACEGGIELIEDTDDAEIGEDVIEINC